VLLSGSASARGRFGLVQSYLNALSWLEAQSMSYDWLILREFLQASPYDGFYIISTRSTGMMPAGNQ
jgi:hypothetical protein